MELRKAVTSDTVTSDAVTSDTGIEYGGFKGALDEASWSGLSRLRLVLMGLLAAFLVPSQYVILKLKLPFWTLVPRLMHRGVCWIAGIRLDVTGACADEGPVLYVANHISWLDIFILGALLPRASFVAKSEIAGWGAAGFLANLQRTLYVNRSRRTDSHLQRDAMMDRLQAGDSLVMFPEGTSTAGVHMAPFKSSLFSVAEQGDAATGHKLWVQPISLSYAEMNGMPLVRAQKPRVAWLGDVELVAHVGAFLGVARTLVTIEFHPPVHVSDVGNRKQLATYCEAAIQAGLERAHRAEYRFGPQFGSSLER